MLEVARSVAFLRMEKKSHKVVRPEPRYVEAEYRQTRPAPRAKLMEDVKTAGKGMVPRAGVEPARPQHQRQTLLREPLLIADHNSLSPGCPRFDV